ncbi:PA14 domain-containing protein [Paenibacillus sp. NPDC056579]|uniref:PA14 domain-containing protein n=1 Tax=Paenibacillus sp. NPDC056579 TaxID=3345871 RepID=UPI003690263E
MKKSIALLNRALVAVLLWTSLFSAGNGPISPVHAEPAATNVFASSTVTASAYGYVSDKYKPSQAIDGNLTSSKWVYQGETNLSDTRNPYWLKVDTGVETTVNQFLLAHAGSAGEPSGYNTRDYTIETSNDDVNWTPVVTVTGNTYAVTTHRLDTPVTARFFKLSIADPGDADASTGCYSAQIYEFQAYGQVESPVAQAPLISASAATAKDQGLLGEYYTGKSDFSFGDYKATTVDPQVNFTNLDPVLQAWTGQQDHANVRWTGQIIPPQTDAYTFYMIGDNGFRLWIDDKLVIDHWVNDWDKEQSSSAISLEGGKKYNVRIEYFEDFGGSNLYLRWSAPSMSKSIVPSGVFYLPQTYSGPVSATVPKEGASLSLTMLEDLNTAPAGLTSHVSVTADDQAVQVQSVEQGSDPSVLKLNLARTVKPGQRVKVTYDGQGALQYTNGTSVASFQFSPANLSEVVNYAPIAIAMSFNGSPKTNRSFAWYTSYEKPQNAPANAKDSIVEIVTADQDFNSAAIKRFVGKPEETRVLTLKITNSTNGSFISHKVLAEGLAPGTVYKYRVGSDNNWSEVGSFMTEAENETNYEFLYMTDSQGAISHDYEVFADTLKQGLEHYPDSKFMVMTGDQVDAGSLESQWLDYFGKPQDMFLKLPIMAAVGNHEGPYNDNYYYHFNYPNDSIQNPLPPGSVYSYDYGDAHIMILNTMDMAWDDRQKESFRQQVEWLKKEVAETDKKWKVVGFHKAIYSLGNHALDTDILDMRKMLYPVFDELGIDVVLQGHDHTFMRSHQMYNNKPVKDVKKDDKGNPLNPDGTLYMINNSAGTKYYDIKNGVDRYYAAVFEQPYEPIFSGIKMTADSFTIESYKSGQDKPFDTYTIVRTDSKPNPVEQLTAGQTGDGRTVLSWNRPQSVQADDDVRGFRILEAGGKLGMNWSAYVPAVEGQDAYQYIAANTVAGETYEFVVKAVDKRDNSVESMVSTSGNVPAAPTAPVVDDGYNTFGWTNVPGYSSPNDYEYSIDGGNQWLPVTANPQPVGDNHYAAGAVKVRVKANATTGAEAGFALSSNEPFTVNQVHDTYKITGEIKRGEQLEVHVTLDPTADYSADAYTVFELLDGDMPILVNAVPVKQNKLAFTQYFNVQGANYKVKVFVMDQFHSDPTLPNQLARPITLQ